MKVLFVPVGGKSHQIPLYVLYQRYFSKMDNVSSAFILPGADHQIFKNKNLNVLDIDYSIPFPSNKSFSLKAVFKLLKEEEETIKGYCPDIIIESLSFGTAAVSEKYEIPRISLQRTGLFRSSNPLFRNSEHIHSMEKDPFSGEIYKVLNFKERNTNEEQVFELADEGYSFAKEIHVNSNPKRYVNSKTKIIPGVPSIEKLPPIKNQDSYFYSGPLNAKDNPTEALQKKISQFFEQNRTRKKVFITTGLIEKQDISEVINFLLQKDYAVVSTVPYQSPDLKYDSFFFNSTLPLNFVCSAVDLVVHHCGSGMYHYPLLHLKPTITIGTQCYDREDVALQLEALGISAHTPAPQDDPDYLGVFKAHLESFEKGTLCDFDQLEKIREEIIDTMLSFDVEKVIDYTLDL